MFKFLAQNQNVVEPELTGGQIFLICLAIIGIVVLIICISHIKFVSQTNAYVIEKLGKYHKTWGAGVHFLVPFIQRIADGGYYSYGKKLGIVSLKEQVIDFAPQPVITKDNVTMQIDTVVYYQISDPKQYVYGVADPIKAIDNLTTTTIRNIIGNLDLDEALTSRTVVNEQVCEILDEATDPWGIKVLRVEIKNIMPPKDIREAMEKQMRAERERREAILLAEGEKRAAILKAEGIKESEILRADAKKEALIREAEGQAKSILAINEATAEGLRMIKEVGLDQSVLSLKALESLEKVADGQATKIIIPSDLQGLAGLCVSAKELFDDKK